MTTRIALSSKSIKLQKIASTSNNNSGAEGNMTDGFIIDEVVVPPPTQPTWPPIVIPPPSGGGGSTPPPSGGGVPTPPGGGGGYTPPYNGGGYTPPQNDPCANAKKLAAAIQNALNDQVIKSAIETLKGYSKNKANEFGFAIIKNSYTGVYSITEIKEGTPTSVNILNGSIPGEIVALVHTHPVGSGAGPSSIDIMGLGDFRYGGNAFKDFAGSIIIRGDEMHMISITDNQAYQKFYNKVQKEQWVDTSTENGWKKKSAPNRKFRDFLYKGDGIYSGNDLGYPAQLYTIQSLNMGISLMKYNGSTGFKVQKISVENRPMSTGSGTTMSPGGTILDHKFLKVNLDEGCK